MAKFWEVYKDTRQPIQSVTSGSWWDNYKIENSTSSKKLAASSPKTSTSNQNRASVNTATQAVESIWDRHDGTSKTTSLQTSIAPTVGGGVLDAPQTPPQSTATKPLTGFAAGVQANNAGYMRMALEKAGLPTYTVPNYTSSPTQPTTPTPVSTPTTVTGTGGQKYQSLSNDWWTQYNDSANAVRTASERANATGAWVDSAISRVKEAEKAYLADPSSEKAYNDYLSAINVYTRFAEQYKPLVDEYNTAYKTYSGYNQEYDNWRNSIRSEEEIRAEMEELDRMIKDSQLSQIGRGYGLAYGGDLDAYLKEEQEQEKLREQYRLLNEELNFSKYFVYGALPENEDFEQMSRPGESRQGGFFDRLFGGRTEAAYDYINNINGYGDIRREEAAARHAEGNADYGTGLEAYDYMTDEQKKTFNYIYNTQGKEPAAEYLKWLEAGFATDGTWVVPSLNALHGLDIAEGFTSDFQRATYGIGAGLDQWGSGVIQLFNKDAVPTSAVQYAGQAARDELGKVGKFIYDAGMVTGNMLPSIALSTITAGAGAPAMLANAVGSITLGASAAGNAYNQALKEGYSPSQARTYGRLVGASEASLQYIIGGIGRLGGVADDMLLKKIAAIDNAWARMALTGAVKIGNEVLEENLQEFIEPAIRSIVFDEKYNAPNVEELIYTTLLTVLTTGLMEGGDIVRAGAGNISSVANTLAAANGKNALESGQNSAYDNIKTGEVENGAEEIHLREGGQWADGKNTGRQIPGMEEGAGRNPGRETGGRSADSETAALTYGREVSAASLGIDGGTDKANVRLVTGGDTTATRAAKQMAREHNLQLVLFAGDNLEIRQRNGSVVSARALIDGDKVYVRADHAEFTAVQLMGHETGHNRIARGEIDPNTVRRRIRQTFGGINTVRLAAMYTAAYAGTGMTAIEVWEEIICDSLGDMNIFSGTARETRAAQLLSAAKAASADAQVENIRGPPAEGKTSLDVFPPYNKSHSDANEQATRWAHQQDVQAGDRKLFSYRGAWYLVEAFDSVDLGYQIVEKLTKKQYEAYIKEANENGHILQSLQEDASQHGKLDKERKRIRGGKHGPNPASAGQRGQNLEVQQVGEKSNEGRKAAGDGNGNLQSSRSGSENVKSRFSSELAEKGNDILLAKLPADRLLYTERLLERAKKNGNLYTQRLLLRQIEKAMQNSHSAGMDASPMPTIYADHIKAREDDLQRLIEEAEEVLSEGSVSAAGEESISADARDKLGEITARGTTKIKQGFSAFSKDDILFERAKLVRPDGNKFDVAMHGTSQSVAFGGREVNMSPRLLAAIIKHNKDYNGQEIRLLSCNTGKKTDDDYCFAEELANALGVTVYAPNDLLIFNDDGTLRIGRSNLGRFVPYGPNERRRLK